MGTFSHFIIPIILISLVISIHYSTGPYKNKNRGESEYNKSYNHETHLPRYPKYIWGELEGTRLAYFFVLLVLGI